MSPTTSASRGPSSSSNSTFIDNEVGEGLYQASSQGALLAVLKKFKELQATNKLV
jgi:hypothetical protein